MEAAHHLAANLNWCSASDYDPEPTNPDCSSQGDAITHWPHAAIFAFATTGIIDTIPIAHIEAALAAVLPDRVLNEPGEDLRK